MKYLIRRGATVQVGEMNFDKLEISAEFEAADFPGITNHEDIAARAEMFVNTRFDDAVSVIQNQVAARLVADRVRLYEINGKQVPSVTSILAFDEGFKTYPAGTAERGKIFHKYLQRYAETGQKDRFTFTEMMEDFPELAPEFKAVQKSGHSLEAGKLPAVIANMEKQGFKILKSEMQVFNEEHFYAGTLDTVAEKDGVQGVLDYKTGAVDDPRAKKTWQQTSAYAKSDSVRENFNIQKMWIVPIDCENKEKVKDILEESRIDTYFSLFLEKRARFRRELKI